MKFVRLRSWVIRLLFSVVILLVILIFIDQWQGGPLGREQPNGFNTEEVTTVVGKRILFGGDMLTNQTHLPITILSVRPTNTPHGLVIKTGIMINPHLGGVILDNQNSKNYSFVNEPIEIPTGESIKSVNPYFYVMEVVPQQSGTYQIDGLIVRYRWGLFTYTVKVESMKFLISAHNKS